MQMPRKQAARKHVPAPFFGLALPSLPFHVAPVPSTHPPSAATLYVGVIVQACRVVLTSIYRRVWAHQKAEGRRTETPAAAAGPSSGCLSVALVLSHAAHASAHYCQSSTPASPCQSCGRGPAARRRRALPSRCPALLSARVGGLLLLVHPQKAGRRWHGMPCTRHRPWQSPPKICHLG